MATHAGAQGQRARPVRGPGGSGTRCRPLFVGGMVAASGFGVAAMDFMAPRLWLLPRIVYTCTFELALAMFFAATVPCIAAMLQSRLGRAAPRHLPLWRRGGWRFGFAWLCTISALGFASVSSADAGGLVASRIAALRGLQQAVLVTRHARP